MTRAEYARYRAAKGLPGQTRQAVGAALKAGRIRLEADGTIDPVVADAQWKVNSKAQPKPLAASPPPVQSTPYADARARREQIKVERDEMALAREKGELLDRKTVESVLSGAMSTLQQRIMASPQRLATQIAAMAGIVDVPAVRELLEDEARRQLEEVSASIRGL